MVWYLPDGGGLPGGGGLLNDDPNEHDPNTDPWQQPTPTNPNVPVPPAAEPATPAAEAGAGGGGGGGAVSFVPSGFPGQAGFGSVPKFVAPIFKPPSAADMLDAPGYQFRVGQGQEGIERSAAARGLLRTGGTLKDISEYNQNFASNEYSNVFNRALQTFGTQYQGAKDEYAPLLAEWTTMANQDLQKALAAYGRDTIWYNPNAKSGGGGGGYAETWNEEYPT